MPGTYALLADLPLRIDGYGLTGHSQDDAQDGESTRRTTVVALAGSGHEGLGEDVGYDAEEQETFVAAGPGLDLAGDWTVDTFSAHLDGLDLFEGREPALPAFRDYRRWAFESAAVDLGLRQAGTNLAARLGREPRPVTFGVSLRLEASAAGVLERIAAYGPSVRFKLDYEAEWTPELIDELAATGTVDVVDFKGAYKGTVVDVETEPAVYRRCAEAFTGAWLEDPDLEDAAAAAALAPYLDRVSWDAPIHAVSDLDRFGQTPKAGNSKPSRFGSWRRLLEFYDHAEATGMVLYGGGQSELGPGRGQIQLLAALFHPDGPNDVAPKGWDRPDFPRTGLPTSPLDPAPDPLGFRRARD